MSLVVSSAFVGSELSDFILAETTDVCVSIYHCQFEWVNRVILVFINDNQT